MDLSGFAYTDVEFDAQGALAAPAEADAAAALASQPGTTDVLVISHGWNDDIPSARALYAAIAASMAQVRGSVPGFASDTLAIVGVLWPSIAFDESQLIPGGAGPLVRIATPDGGQDAGQAALGARLDSLQGFFTAPNTPAVIAHAKELVPTLTTSADDRRAFADLVRSLLSPQAAAESDADASDAFLTLDGDTLISRLSAPVRATPPASTGVASADDLGSVLKGVAGGVEQGVDTIVQGADNVLNLTTFYEMKARAGTVGQTGVAALLARLYAAAPKARIHLAGHSFGARLVTAAVNATGAATPLMSVSLLQGAFSHYSFAQAWDGSADGFFRPIVADRLLGGPMIITHTANDQAVGIAYALASRLPGQFQASALLGVGGPDDKYGGLGANGSQKTPEATWTTMQDVGGAYDLAPGIPANLLADAYIHSHSDVKGPQVAYAVLTAIATA